MIVLTRKGIAIQVDPEDFSWVSAYTWSLSYGYPVTRRNKKLFRLSRLLVAAPVGMVVDHINGDPLDNRRANLRICTQAHNCFNTSKRSGTYRGVHFDASRKKWVARIAQTMLGRFETEEAAARAWDLTAREWYGPYARLNFSEDVA